MYIRLVLLVATLTTCVLGRVRVGVEDGDILLVESGKRVVLTSTGRDADPWIDPDGKVVLFVRGDVDDEFRTAVFEINVMSRVEHKVFAGPIQLRGGDINYFGDPEYSNDHKTLYLVAKTSVTTGDLFAVDTNTKVVRHIAEAASYDVIQSGPNAGDLLVYKRKISIVGMPFYLYWLYSPNGKDLGLAGPDGLDVANAINPDRSAGAADGGTTHSLERNATGSADQSVTLHLDKKALDARLLRRIVPQYPSTAGLQGVAGVVELVVTVSPEGSVVGVKLVSGPPALVEAAMVAVKQWKYSPVVDDAGKPVAVTGVVDVPFPAK
jgi:TonB family protein